MKAISSRVLTISLIVMTFLATLWLVFRKTSEQPNGSIPAPRVTPHESIGVHVPRTSPPAHGAAVTPPSFGVQAARYKAAFVTPIVFFGKVLDQFDHPVPGADVKCYANDNPLKSGSRYFRTTDQEGLFSISGAVGISLAVEVSKRGYLVITPSDSVVTSSGLFEYAVGTNTHVPNRQHPVVFRLHKVGPVERLLKIGEKNFRMARDGTPLSIAVDGQGGHQVVLRCWNQELDRPSGQRQYDWRLEISVPSGGLLVRKDAFAFQAPVDGYIPSDTVEMSASLSSSEWDSFAERSYFIRFSDGTFARANFRMRAAGDHFVVWESFYNPKAGSPNLACGSQ